MKRPRFVKNWRERMIDAAISDPGNGVRGNSRALSRQQKTDSTARRSTRIESFSYAFFAAQRFLSAATIAARPAAESFRFFTGAGVARFEGALDSAHLLR